MRRLLIALVFAICVIQAGIVFARLTFSGVSYYRVVRLHVLVNTQCGMLMGTWFIWSRIDHLIRSHTESESPRLARIRWRTICVRDVARAALVLYLALCHVAFFFYYTLLGNEPHLLAVISLTAIAGYLHLAIFLTLAEIVTGIARCCEKQDGKELSSSLRTRSTLIAVILSCLLITAGFLTTWAKPLVKEVVVDVKKLPADAPLRVALLSDIHIGPTVGESRMRTIVDETNRLQPDIVAIAGDLADGFVAQFSKAAAPLCDLTTKYGVYFATGNHEYMHGNVDEWFAFLQQCNITVLHNAARRFPHKSATVCVAGTDDIFAAKAHLPGHGMDPRQALAACESTDVTVLLAHQPNAARTILDDPIVGGKPDLVVSGHTHGGQMYPLVPVVYVANAFTRGLYHYKQSAVYVSAGVNFFGPPVKMLGSCEIIHLTLTSV